jgi:nitroimidazol reductase NimA-like FMN-containing flavoprotein (pyridoxamine 5'-phosphate oxidase superfamily)
MGTLGRRKCGAEGKVRAMSPDEARQFLEIHNWGMLCTVSGGEPYAVPVSFGFDGHYVYIATGAGRKAHNVDANRSVSLTVAEVQNGDSWRSVIVSGKAEWLDDTGAKLRALNILRRDRIQGSLPSPLELARIARSRVFRIVPKETTGRIRG